MYLLFHSELITRYSFFETNVAIMVACMPACATLYKHTLNKLSTGSSMKAWFGNLRHSTCDKSPMNTESGPRSTKSVRLGSDNGNRSVWHQKNGPRCGRLPRALTYDTEGCPTLSSRNATMSKSKGSLDFYHASFDLAHEITGHKEDV